jgi:uncharacterized protein (TIGR02996 family)
MNAERKAFLDSIEANPDEAHIRLIYADYLEERGIVQESSICPGCDGTRRRYIYQGHGDFEIEDCWSCDDNGLVTETIDYHRLACDQRLAAKMIAIRAKPDDDGLRLEWADIAERYERKERAEFVRVQVELADLGPREHVRDPGSIVELNVYARRESRNDRRMELRQRETALFHEHWRETGWGHGVLSDYFRTTIDPSTFVGRTDACALLRRGFISAVSLTLQQAREHLPTICREHPVTSVTITDCEPGYVERDPGFNNWTWFNNESRPRRSTIPRDIWMLVEGGWFSTEENAMLALSRAVLKWAKGER